MGEMAEPPSPALPSDQDPAAGQEKTTPESMRVDETGAASFPASDPPAVWTWEVKRTPAAPEAHSASKGTS